MSELATLVDEAGAEVCRVAIDPPTVESDDPEVAGWATAGVPSLRGVISDEGVASHEEVVVAPDDPLWGLALLEEAERRGWSRAPEGEVQPLEEALELREAKEVQGRLLVRKTRPRAGGGMEIDPDAEWEDAGLFQLGPGAAGVQSAIAQAQADGKTWLTVDPHPRRFHGKCPECKKPVTALVTERIAVGSKVEYGHVREVVTRTPLQGEWQASDAVDVTSAGVTIRCPRDGRLVRASAIKGKFSAEVPCDARCTGAKGSSCECQCGGLNHGSAHGV